MNRPEIDISQVLKVIELQQQYPLATAVVERGFSVLKQVKTDSRTCLKNEILDSHKFRSV